METLSNFWPMFLFFGMAVIGGIGFPPIPEEVVVIGAGIWVASTPDIGPLRWLALPVCVVGILISDVLLYGVGRIWGTRLMRLPGLARLMPTDKRQQIEDNFHHYGLKILLFVRWLPGIRSPMFITVGLMRLPLVRFIIADAIAAAVGHTLLFFLAWWFGDRVLELVKRAEDRLGPIVIITAIAAVGVFFLVRYLKRPVTTGDPEELPLIGHQVAAKLDSSMQPGSLHHPAGQQADGSPCEPKSDAWSG